MNECERESERKKTMHCIHTIIVYSTWSRLLLRTMCTSVLKIMWWLVFVSFRFDLKCTYLFRFQVVAWLYVAVKAYGRTSNGTHDSHTLIWYIYIYLDVKAISALAHWWFGHCCKQWINGVMASYLMCHPMQLCVMKPHYFIRKCNWERFGFSAAVFGIRIIWPMHNLSNRKKFRCWKCPLDGWMYVVSSMRLSWNTSSITTIKEPSSSSLPSIQN